MTSNPVANVSPVDASSRCQRSRARRNRSGRGFTLVELMVVITIIAVLSGMAIGVNGTAYGASATAVGDQLTSAFSVAKLRALSTRRYTRLEVKAQTATLWQSTQTGMVTPTNWQYVQTFTIPNGVSVWDGSTTVYATPGATVSQNTAVDFAVDFKPDGSSTGGTVFVTDRANAHSTRVLVYRATGSSYARADW
jgi:prepilin-type N-terminal cleavage/methylation domain-containing protein